MIHITSDQAKSMQQVHNVYLTASLGLSRHQQESDWSVTRKCQSRATDHTPNEHNPNSRENGTVLDERLIEPFGTPRSLLTRYSLPRSP
jgi:hypothetical protein